MAFKLKRHEPAAKGVNRLILREIHHALNDIAQVNHHENKTVHDVRTHCKKIRAVLRLARGQMGNKAYHRANQCFRDTARPLRRIRDAVIHLKTLDSVAKDRFPAIRNALQHDYQIISMHALNQGHVFPVIANRLENARARLKNSAMKGNGRKALRSGLRHTYRQGQRAYNIAAKYPAAANFHEWRKQVKYLWYQLKLMRRIQPQTIKPLERQCSTLAQILGDDHDLSMLYQAVGDRDEKNIEPLSALINRRRKKLQEKALKLGRHIYGGKPKAFMGRLHL